MVLKEMYLYGIIYGNIAYNLIIAIAVIAIALYFKELLRFERKEFSITKEKASLLPTVLRSKGLRVVEEKSSVSIEGPLRTTFDLIEEGESESLKVVQSSEIAPWFLSLVVIILALNAVLGLALGFLGYLYYRWTRGTLSSIPLINP